MRQRYAPRPALVAPAPDKSGPGRAPAPLRGEDSGPRTAAQPPPPALEGRLLRQRDTEKGAAAGHPPRRSPPQGNWPHPCLPFLLLHAALAPPGPRPRAPAPHSRSGLGSLPSPHFLPSPCREDVEGLSSPPGRGPTRRDPAWGRHVSHGVFGGKTSRRPGPLLPTEERGAHSRGRGSSALARGRGGRRRDRARRASPESRVQG